MKKKKIIIIVVVLLILSWFIQIRIFNDYRSSTSVSTDIFLKERVFYNIYGAKIYTQKGENK